MTKSLQNKNSSRQSLSLIFKIHSIMRKINPKCTNIDSFKYSILISIHYYDITPYPERIPKLGPYINKYKFTTTLPKDFERNNPNISLTTYDEKNNMLYSPRNNSNKKAYIIKINNHKYNATKLKKPKSIKLKELLSSFTYEELSIIFQEIIMKKVDTN